MNTLQAVVPSLKNPAGNADRMKEDVLKKACRDFEALLIEQMIATMRSSVPKGGLMDGGFAEEMLQPMQDERMAKELAEHGGFGLADAMYRQITTRTGKG
ncbi:MAG: rod-binding protein [Thermodesulfobacteriota bacterium]